MIVRDLTILFTILIIADTAVPSPIPQEDGGCATFCIFSFEPVCGSDGKTYSNTCLLEVEACNSKKAIEVAAKGPCKTKPKKTDEDEDIDDIPANRESAAFGRDNDDRSDDEDEGIAAAAVVAATPEEDVALDADEEDELETFAKQGCPIGCPKILRRVCGSDGQIYDNECLLKEASCIKTLSSDSTYFQLLPGALTRKQDLYGEDNVDTALIVQKPMAFCDSPPPKPQPVGSAATSQSVNQSERGTSAPAAATNNRPQSYY